MFNPLYLSSGPVSAQGLLGLFKEFRTVLYLGSFAFITFSCSMHKNARMSVFIAIYHCRDLGFFLASVCLWSISAKLLLETIKLVGRSNVFPFYANLNKLQAQVKRCRYKYEQREKAEAQPNTTGSERNRVVITETTRRESGIIECCPGLIYL